MKVEATGDYAEAGSLENQVPDWAMVPDTPLFSSQRQRPDFSVNE
jgi:hypothetical protein